MCNNIKYYKPTKKATYANGCFNLEANWIPSDFVANIDDCTGYIVQKITRSINASDSFLEAISDEMKSYEHEYYEAWPVERGVVQLNANYGFHDQWKYMVDGYYGMLEDFKMKYRTSGCLTMNGSVYWVGQEMPEYQIVQTKFKEGAITYAGELLSASKFDDANHMEVKCIREQKGRWNFENDEHFINCLVNYSKLGQKCHKSWIKDIEDIFNGMSIWQQLVDTIYKTSLLEEDAN